MRGSVKRMFAAAALLVAALSLPSVLLAAETVDGDQSGISPRSNAANAESCVRPVEQMRRDHMELLKHKRDETMYHGIRTADVSIVGCIDCHADRSENGEFVPVNGEGQFCESCHTAVAAKLDCFECHRTTPEPTLTE